MSEVTYATVVQQQWVRAQRELDQAVDEHRDLIQRSQAQKARVHDVTTRVEAWERVAALLEIDLNEVR